MHMKADPPKSATPDCTAGADWRTISLDEWTVPDDWCYQCGITHLVSQDCSWNAQPRTLDWAATAAGMHAADELGCLPERKGDWTPGHIASVRELAQLLTEWADSAERAADYRQRTAASA